MHVTVTNSLPKRRVTGSILRSHCVNPTNPGVTKHIIWTILIKYLLKKIGYKSSEPQNVMLRKDRSYIPEEHNSRANVSKTNVCDRWIRSEFLPLMEWNFSFRRICLFVFWSRRSHSETGVSLITLSSVCENILNVYEPAYQDRKQSTTSKWMHSLWRWFNECLQLAKTTT